jgi:hypothetical protein
MWKLRQLVDQQEQREQERVDRVLCRFSEHTGAVRDEPPLFFNEVQVLYSEVTGEYNRLGCLGKYVHSYIFVSL